MGGLQEPQDRSCRSLVCGGSFSASYGPVVGELSPWMAWHLASWFGETAFSQTGCPSEAPRRVSMESLPTELHGRAVPLLNRQHETPTYIYDIL